MVLTVAQVVRMMVVQIVHSGLLLLLLLLLLEVIGHEKMVTDGGPTTTSEMMMNEMVMVCGRVGMMQIDARIVVADVMMMVMHPGTDTVVTGNRKPSITIDHTTHTDTRR
uniref:Putative secreted protein n=1 Tax=Anopheles darlingi TaxID=43151 RepID=A0A2M4D576_ANODA